MSPRRIWVIGGTSGIGAAIAERIQHDYDPVALYVTGNEVDVQSQHEITNFAKEYGPFDGLVYSAGINKLAWSKDISTIDMMAIYDINVVGLIRALRACPELRRVVVIGSDAARRPMRTSLMYCASKAALDIAVKVIARERASNNFTINCIAPGMTDHTNMTTYIDAAVPEVRGWTEAHASRYERSQTQMGRRAVPEEIAEVAVSVLYMDTPYLNGATIEVNGGR